MRFLIDFPIPFETFVAGRYIVIISKIILLLIANHFHHLQGGSPSRAKTVRKIVDGGVAVMGHVGLTPQAISVIGGFRAQGRTASKARSLLDEALRLQDSGAFAIVLECVPEFVATKVTETLEIPTIGIGAGAGTSGQVLVYHDMLGMSINT